MVKLNLEELKKAGGLPGVSTGGDDFFSKAEKVIEDLNKLGNTILKLQSAGIPLIGDRQAPPDQQPKALNVGQPPAKSGGLDLEGIARGLREYGLDKVKVGDALKKLSPMTLGELIGVLKNANRLKR